MKLRVIVAIDTRGFVSVNEVSNVAEHAPRARYPRMMQVI